MITDVQRFTHLDHILFQREDTKNSECQVKRPSHCQRGETNEKHYNQQRREVNKYLVYMQHATLIQY